MTKSNIIFHNAFSHIKEVVSNELEIAYTDLIRLTTIKVEQTTNVPVRDISVSLIDGTSTMLGVIILDNHFCLTHSIACTGPEADDLELVESLLENMAEAFTKESTLEVVRHYNIIGEY